MTHPQVERKPETMGRRLASRRALLGWSQTEAAEKAGFTQAYLSRLENDESESTPINTVAKLAELYGVSLDYLVNGVAA
jgi:transcriptional regulator with XRE-family HTH domain